MKMYLAGIIILLCLAFAQAGKQSRTVFDQLYILEGKWAMKTKKGFILEEWTKIDKGYLQSRGYSIRDNDTIINERVALRNTPEGIFYISTVEGQNNKQPVSFRLTSSNNKTFVFENPQHDFPKRISYQFINKDSLYAWIDDGKEIPEKKFSFRYNREK